MDNPYPKFAHALKEAVPSKMTDTHISRVAAPWRPVGVGTYPPHPLVSPLAVARTYTNCQLLLLRIFLSAAVVLRPSRRQRLALNWVSVDVMLERCSQSVCSYVLRTCTIRSRAVTITGECNSRLRQCCFGHTGTVKVVTVFSRCH